MLEQGINLKMSTAVKVSYDLDESDDGGEEDSENSATDYDSDGEQVNLKSQAHTDRTAGRTPQDDKDAKASQGLASVMAQILGKSMPKKKTAILAKAQTDKQINKRKVTAKVTEPPVTFEIAGEEGAVKKVKTEVPDPEELDHDKTMRQRMKKRLWEEMARVRPNVLEKERERNLQKIATRGVVQLFNAVKQQQKTVEEKLKEAGPSVRKQDHALQSITKSQFIDVLKGAATNASLEPVNKMKKKVVDGKVKVKEEAIDSDEDAVQCDKNGDKPSWDILREDFMMGAKMKDWDKESDEEEEGEENMGESEDSDT